MRKSRKKVRFFFLSFSLLRRCTVKTLICMNITRWRCIFLWPLFFFASLSLHSQIAFRCVQILLFLVFFALHRANLHNHTRFRVSPASATALLRYFTLSVSLSLLFTFCVYCFCVRVFRYRVVRFFFSRCFVVYSVQALFLSLGLSLLPT